ncbi:MAG: ThiF family adenylyltransferase [Planctomycetia bacterium]|nr:ThiF family adenylyltransferase [Planctomycetia bacterium]
MPNPSTPHLKRDIRQRDIVPPERLANCHALVIGVGAIGRQVALQLAAIGMPCLTLVDHDDVRIENLAPQGYLVEDVQAFKVDATAALCRRINPEIEVTTLAERFKRSSARDLGSDQRLIVFACVDSIVTRRLVWEAVRLRAALFIDGRMSAEVIRVLAVDAAATDRYYPQTLFTMEEAYAGACTARSTIYAASIAAGLMLGQMTRWLRGLPVDADLMLNLLATELTVGAVATT